MIGPPDTPQILYEALTLEGGPLTALIGSRAWCPIAPSDWQNTEPAVVYTFLTPAAEPGMERESGQVNVRCYGGTSQYGDANDLVRLLLQQLHDKRFDLPTGGLDCWESSKGWGLRDPDTGWPYAMTTLQYTAIAKEIAS